MTVSRDLLHLLARAFLGTLDGLALELQERGSGNKIGIDVAVEALRDFSHTHRGGANELARFARICRVSRVMQPYLDAVVLTA